MYLITFLVAIFGFLFVSAGYCSDLTITSSNDVDKREPLQLIVERYIPDQAFKDGNVFYTKEQIEEDVYLHEYKVRMHDDMPDNYVFVVQVRDRIFVVGNLFVVKDGKINSITMEKINVSFNKYKEKLEQRVMEFYKKIDKNKLIRIGSEKKKNKLVVILSTNCPYCRNLVKDMIKNNYSEKFDVTFYVVLVSSDDDIRHVLCSKDKAKSLLDIMQEKENGKKIKKIFCNINVDSYSNYYRNLINDLKIGVVPFVFNNRCAISGWNEFEVKSQCFE